MYLIIDTISKQSLVALGEKGGLVGKIIWQSNYKQSEELLVKVDELLTENGVRQADLTGVVVVNGPGSYTGIRVGVATGNALGFALGASVVGVSYLDILASWAVGENNDSIPELVDLPAGRQEGLNFGGGKIVALVNSIADKYYYGIYKERRGKIKLIGDYGNDTLEDILEKKRGINCVVGEIDKGARGDLGNDILFLPADYSVGGVVEKLVELGGENLAGAVKDNLCEPLYINQPNITPSNKK
ncbi:MAG: tRNA (adenosine(37)-N6)-threonylcarbamoyltransferase complex dimerization subunit type 1 TsaB [Parcubacteria group bacterium]|nr:tRNA (adenosine(37)-N6)-threonylcarbamoyltransferase complex dimerization subunit type 1 TsaB [Parcubacteria group bacterium]